mgnify:CR=1 FL=1
MSGRTTKMNARVWPVGTMVVTLREVEPGDGGRARPKGACGVIVKSPEDPDGIYRIGFPDGGEFNVAAKSLDILKHYQQGELANVEAVAQSHKLYDRIHYKCVVGSRAYGLDHAESDTDLRGFYLAPAKLHWSLFGTPEQLQRPESDECYWELEKFLKLAQTDIAAKSWQSALQNLRFALSMESSNEAIKAKIAEIEAKV